MPSRESRSVMLQALVALAVGAVLGCLVDTSALGATRAGVLAADRFFHAPAQARSDPPRMWGSGPEPRRVVGTRPGAEDRYRDAQIWPRVAPRSDIAPQREVYRQEVGIAAAEATSEKTREFYSVWIPVQGVRRVQPVGKPPLGPRPAQAAAVCFLPTSDSLLPATDMLLIDRQGRPYGRVEFGTSCRLAVPFQGFLLAPGRTPVPAPWCMSSRCPRRSGRVANWLPAGVSPWGRWPRAGDGSCCPAARGSFRILECRSTCTRANRFWHRFGFPSMGPSVFVCESRGRRRLCMSPPTSWTTRPWSGRFSRGVFGRFRCSCDSIRVVCLCCVGLKRRSGLVGYGRRMGGLGGSIVRVAHLHLETDPHVDWGGRVRSEFTSRGKRRFSISLSVAFSLMTPCTPV